jgi:two-component system LytT family response regulator
MIRALIIDDEFSARDGLKRIVKQYCPEITIVGTGENVKEAIYLINQHAPDLVFLDIEMPNGNGFTLFDTIKSPQFETIFITAYEEYAIKAFRVAALDYLTKPVDYRQLRDSIDKLNNKRKIELKEQRIELLIQNIANKPTEFNKIVLPDYNGFTLVDVSNILFCKADGSYTEVYLIDGRVITTSRLLKSFEELLPNETFFRIHRSYLVNLNLIKRFNKSEGFQVIMENNIVLDVSERNKKELVEKLNNK